MDSSVLEDAPWDVCLVQCVRELLNVVRAQAVYDAAEFSQVPHVAVCSDLVELLLGWIGDIVPGALVVGYDQHERGAVPYDHVSIGMGEMAC